jgi:hypothetical protein
MTNRIPLIVNAGAAQIQEVSASDVLTVPGTVTANVVQTDNYQYANGQPFAGGGGNYGNSNVATFLADFGSNTISTTGDVTANAFVGDGSQLTNLPLATNSTVGVVALGNGFTLNSSNQVTTSSLYNTNLTQPTQHYALRVDTNGVVILPDQSIINGSTLRAVAGSYAGLTTDDGENSWMWVDSTGAYIATQYNESGNSHQWTFDNTGNLTLPSDGGAGAASVTINFAGVGYTTETNVPTNALTGAGSGMTVDIVASLSGSNPITNVTINQAGTGYAPGDSIQVAQSSSTGNGTLTVVSVNPVTIPSINYANGQPYGSSANTGNVTFNDINIIGTGNLHLQPDPANTGSYLDIFLTSGPDLHLVASASANLILGKDDGANVMTSWNGNVYVQSWDVNTDTQGGVWTFDSNGVLNVPLTAGGSSNQIKYGMGNLVSWLDGQWTIGEYNGSNFGTQGIRVSPGIEGNVEVILPSDAAANIDALQLNNYVGNVQVIANGNTWTFGNDGSFTPPNQPSNDRTGSGLTLKIGNENTQAIITGPAPVANVYNAAPRLVIAGQDGVLDGEGGDIYLWAGRSGPDGGTGGDIKVDAGIGQNGSDGGTIKIRGGNSVSGAGSAIGGFVEIDAGSGNVGGQIYITAGTGVTAGGNANVIGGYTYSGPGGQVNIIGGGSSDGLPYYGNVLVATGASNWLFDNTGNLTLPSTTSNINYSNGVNILNDITTTGNFVFDTADLDGVAFDEIALTGTNSGNILVNADGLVAVLGGYESSGMIADAGNAYIFNNDPTFVDGIPQPGVGYTWQFDNTGKLLVPQGGWIGAAGVKGDGTMLTGGTGNIASLTSFYADAPGVYSSCLTANPDGTLNITTYGNGTGQLGQWIFSGADLSAPGNITAGNISLNGGYINGGVATVVNDGINSIALALGAQMDVFTFPFTVVPTRGQLTISGDISTTEALGTWYYQATSTNAYQLYTDGSYSTLVDATTWTPYTGGGAVAITEQTPAANIVIDANGFVSTFTNNGQLNLPGSLTAVGDIGTDGNVYARNIVAEAPFIVIATNFEANIGGRYGVDTTGGTVTATLSNTPPTGGAVFFADAGGAYSSNNLIIDPNGGTIMGATGNMTVSTPNQSVGLFYNGTTWRIYNAG